MPIKIDEGLFNNFDERELRLIRNCLTYAANDPAGVPGHGLMLVVSKLMKMIQDPSDRYVSKVILEKIDNYSQEWNGDLDNLQFDLKNLIYRLEGDD